jgi:hypothetical protein
MAQQKRRKSIGEVSNWKELNFAGVINFGGVNEKSSTNFASIVPIKNRGYKA